MNREEILSHVDHTLLKPEATWPQIQTLCDEAIANHTASVCINTCYVKQAVEYMAGRIKGIGFTVQAVQIKLIPHNTISVLVKDRSFPKLVMLKNQVLQRSTIVGALTCDVL